MKIGDRVMLKEATDSPQGEALAGLSGTVCGCRSESPLPFDVKWDNGFEFAVNEDEIQPLNPGRWQREMPQKEGLYWTRTADGEEASILAVCKLPSGELFTPARLPATPGRTLRRV